MHGNNKTNIGKFQIPAKKATQLKATLTKGTLMKLGEMY
jgi:hypothetical protein